MKKLPAGANRGEGVRGRGGVHGKRGLRQIVGPFGCHLGGPGALPKMVLKIRGPEGAQSVPKGGPGESKIVKISKKWGLEAVRDRGPEKV